MSAGDWIAIAAILVPTLGVVLAFVWRMSAKITKLEMSVAGLESGQTKILGILEAAAKEKQDDLKERAERAEKAARNRGWGILSGRDDGEGE